MTILLRDYQSEALTALRRHIASGAKRLILVSPTGSGKTTIAAEMIRGAAARGNGVLFLAHRDELITQASDRLLQFDVEHGVIKAGTDRAKPRALVQVASVQTLMSRFIKKGPTLFGGAMLPPARLIIVDEAHRTMSATYLKVLAAYPGAAVIGLTATPVRLDGKGLGDVYQDLVEAARIEDLVAQGVLMNPRVFAPPPPDLSGVKMTAGDYNARQLEAAINKPKLVGSIVQHWKQHANGHRTVVFAVSIEHSMSIRDEFRLAGVAAEHVDGSTETSERRRILKGLKDGRVQVVCNVNVLTEGWDLPECACAVIARPTKSVSMYLQMAGRILRTAPGKTEAIILDHAGCTRLHNLVTAPREWTLTSTRPKGEAPIKTCPNCYAVVSAAATICRECNYVWEELKDAGEREGIEKDEATALVEVDDRYPVLEPKDAWLENFRVPGNPTRDDKLAAYDEIARRWMNFQKGPYPKKTGWIAVNFKKIWGMWPHHTIVGACGFDEVRDAVEAARVEKRDERMRAEFGMEREAG